MTPAAKDYNISQMCVNGPLKVPSSDIFKIWENQGMATNTLEVQRLSYRNVIFGAQCSIGSIIYQYVITIILVSKLANIITGNSDLIILCVHGSSSFQK